ncbi:hypothetical protein J6590_102702 [Homalodisca vitripennis]|nr:hypothetical protein J6590_102702 [Homalodisca vitripennis]
MLRHAVKRIHRIRYAQILPRDIRKVVNLGQFYTTPSLRFTSLPMLFEWYTALYVTI